MFADLAHVLPHVLYMSYLLSKKKILPLKLEMIFYFTSFFFGYEQVRFRGLQLNNV